MSTQIGGSTTTPPDEAPRASLFPLWAQRAFAAIGALALLGLLVAIGTQIAATQPGGTPARVVPVQAGPYPLTVTLYKDPAAAGYALPFAITPTRPVNGALRYSVLSLPHPGVDATPISGSVTPDPRVPNRVTGTIEITVQGEWELNIVVDGPAGRGIANIPVTAKAPPGLPGWVAWLIGLVPAIGLALFFAAQRRRAGEPVPADATATPDLQKRD